MAALLQVASRLEIPALINRYVHSSRRYTPKKPIRNHLTVGITLLLGAIGRICMPASKDTNSKVLVYTTDTEPDSLIQWMLRLKSIYGHNKVTQVGNPDKEVCFPTATQHTPTPRLTPPPSRRIINTRFVHLK